METRHLPKFQAKRDCGSNILYFSETSFTWQGASACLRVFHANGCKGEAVVTVEITDEAKYLLAMYEMRVFLANFSSAYKNHSISIRLFSSRTD